MILRPTETERLTQRHPVPVLFPQIHTIPSSPPPAHSNLYITNEHLSEDKRGRSICGSNPTTYLWMWPIHSNTPAVCTEEAGRLWKEKASHAQILSKGGHVFHSGSVVSPAYNQLCISIPSGPSHLIHVQAARVKHSTVEREKEPASTNSSLNPQQILNKNLSSPWR